MLQTLSIGLIGYGRIGKIHYNNLCQDPRIGAIYVATKSGAEDLDKAFVFEDYAVLLDSVALDAVVICSPTPTHIDIIRHCCRLGLPVFCEKPLDLSLDKIQDIQREVNDTGIKVQMGFNRRWDPYFADLKKRIDQGIIGSILQTSIFSRDPGLPHREFLVSSGGMFLDMTIHDFDMCLYLMGHDVAEIYTHAGAYIDPTLSDLPDIDTATTMLSFESGATCTITNCRASGYGYDQRVEVFGTKGLLLLPNKLESGLIHLNSYAEHRALPQHFFLERYDEAYRLEMDAFIEMVINNQEPAVGIKDAERATILALAAQESYLTNQPVQIKWDK